MTLDFHQKTKCNLKIVRKTPIPGAVYCAWSKRRNTHPGICHKLLMKPGQNLNKDGMTSLYLTESLLVRTK